MVEDHRLKKICIFLFSLGFFLSLLGISYAIFSLTLEESKEHKIVSGTLALVLDDTMGEALSLENMYPMLDAAGMKQKSYQFTLENTGDVSSKYTIYIDDLPLLDSESRLSDRDIRYNIQNDQGLNVTKNFSQLLPSPNRVLDSGVILPGEKYSYTLRVWLDYDADNTAMSKVMKGKIRVEATQDTEYLPSTLVYVAQQSVPEGQPDNRGYFWVYKENITKVVFQDRMKKPVGTVQEWDVSVSNDGAIMAYLTGEEAQGYTLYIQAGGPIQCGRMVQKLFYQFSRLKEIKGLEHLDTSNVVNMMSMFEGCSQLTKLDLNSLNMSKVEHISGMFYGCTNLVELSISAWDVSSVGYAFEAFRDCQSLTTLDLPYFDAPTLVNAWGIFHGCKSLTTIDLSHFNTSRIENMMNMFSGCEGLTRLDLSTFDTSSATKMNSMFVGCKNLTSLDLSNFDTSNVIDMAYMFNSCIALVDLNISSFDTNKVENMSSMFANCQGFVHLDLSCFETASLKIMANMFQRCSNLVTVDLSHFNTSQVTDMSTMFQECQKLTQLNLSFFNTSNVETMARMFDRCSSLVSLDLSTFVTERVTNMYYMFWNCNALMEIDFRQATFTQVTESAMIFDQLPGATRITVKSQTEKDWVLSQNGGFTDANVIIAI